jgi:hypothetical protein
MEDVDKMEDGFSKFNRDFLISNNEQDNSIISFKIDNNFPLSGG